MADFLGVPPALAWSIVSLLLAAVVIAALWDRVKWWWMNTWYSFPLIGRIARASVSDKKLCTDYKKFIRLRSKHDYDEKIKYLSKSGDTGRSGTPAFIWILTVVMVFVEAMGFSYVLAGYTIPGASENTQQMGAFGIAFLISVLLVALTHMSGHELYISSKISTARRSWVDAGRKRALFTGNIPLEVDQSVDDAEPYYTQLVNRVGEHAKYIVTIGTVIFVLVVAIGSTYVRGKVLDKQLHDQVSGQLDMGSASNNMSLDLGSLTLPEADQAEINASNDKVRQDGQDIDKVAGWGTFIVLAFIFVFLQFLGVLFGYRWGFASKQGEQAFKAIGSGRYSGYEDVLDHYREVADLAQAKLEGLQNSRNHRSSRSGTSADEEFVLTFEKFMASSRGEVTKDFKDQINHEKDRKDLTPPAAPIQYADESTTKSTTTPVKTTASVAPTSSTTVQTESADDELERLTKALEAKRLAAAKVESEAPTQPVVVEPESADEELARLEKELEAKRQAAAKAAKIEAMKRELAAMENGDKPA